MDDKEPSGARLIDLDRPGVVVRPPLSRRFRSRVVELPPGGQVGLHTTHQREELVVVLKGAGELHLPGGDPERLPLAAGRAAYIPPETPHDIHNLGPELLRYIYVVARLD